MDIKVLIKKEIKNRKIGNGKWEMGNGKWEMGNGKWEMGIGLCGILSRSSNLYILIAWFLSFSMEILFGGPVAARCSFRGRYNHFELPLRSWADIPS